MKYEQLFKLMQESGGITIRTKEYPEKIVQPKTGYMVGISWLGMQLDDDEPDTFDEALDRALQFWGGDFPFLNLSVHDHVVYIDPVDVFSANRKEFAMGVAYGRQETTVYDIANDKYIALR